MCRMGLLCDEKILKRRERLPLGERMKLGWEGQAGGAGKKRRGEQDVGSSDCDFLKLCV